MESLLGQAGISLAASLLRLPLLSAPLALFAKAQPIEISDQGSASAATGLNSPEEISQGD